MFIMLGLISDNLIKITAKISFLCEPQRGVYVASYRPNVASCNISTIQARRKQIKSEGANFLISK